MGDVVPDVGSLLTEGGIAGVGAKGALLQAEEPGEEAPDEDSALFPVLVAEAALSPMFAKPGEQVRFSGKCLKDTTPGDKASINFYWTAGPLEAEIANSFWFDVVEFKDDGTFDQIFTIAEDAVPGTYRVPTTSCWLEDQSWDSAEIGMFTVLSDGTPGGGSGGESPVVPVLAETGNGASSLLLWSAVAVGVLGVGFVARARYAGKRLNSDLW
ncbi:hypothetical protein G7066_07960 [Leucobacter coleopterorum]|uniref:LPXTG-motif cell wall anchor domain-containing protein n=1 Tax=Leucobacter coleopterorum TaxID=2714933 RepID=A0ABX6K0I6_9MICO|nr:hypothetical protein [Leucobacter coleopterorum]QIM18570.1 hypothetical protein G7066_07960 [Leucobacter coleopterorum]